MMLRTLIVDDEVPARRRLVRQLQALPEVQVVGEAGDGLEALDAVAALTPDLLLLDVRMPELDGLALAQRHTAVLPLIVFTTAYDTFAVQAFEIHAVDYLLKPIPQERLAQAIARAQLRHRQGALGRAATTAALDVLAQRPAVPRIATLERGAVRFFDARGLSRLYALDKYTAFCEGGVEHLTQEPLLSLEERLRPHGFLRVHRGELINLARVRSLRCEDGVYTLELIDGQHARVSRRLAGAVKDALVPVRACAQAATERAGAQASSSVARPAGDDRALQPLEGSEDDA